LLRSLKRIDRPLTQVQAGGSHKLSKFVLQPAPGTKSISAFQRFLPIVLRSIGVPSLRDLPGNHGEDGIQSTNMGCLRRLLWLRDDVAIWR
jgi:hypothetical protein